MNRRCRDESAAHVCAVATFISLFWIEVCYYASVVISAPLRGPRSAVRDPVKKPCCRRVISPNAHCCAEVGQFRAARSSQGLGARVLFRDRLRFVHATNPNYIECGLISTAFLGLTAPFAGLAAQKNKEEAGFPAPSDSVPRKRCFLYSL